MKPMRGRILVDLLPVSDEFKNHFNLVIVDMKKHFQHTTRRGKVVGIGAGVYGVCVGDVVVFRGDAGTTIDFDPSGLNGIGDENSQRWLVESDCMAILEPVKELSGAV